MPWPSPRRVCRPLLSLAVRSASPPGTMQGVGGSNPPSPAPLSWPPAPFSYHLLGPVCCLSVRPPAGSVTLGASNTRRLSLSGAYATGRILAHLFAKSWAVQAATSTTIACRGTGSSGMGSPSAINCSIQSSMASLAWSAASSTVLPQVKQPGIAGDLHAVGVSFRIVFQKDCVSPHCGSFLSHELTELVCCQPGWAENVLDSPGGDIARMLG